MRRLLETRTPIQGAADHLVSEAIYLADPEGNGIELYRDRPRDQWTFDGEFIRMASDPLDLESLLEEAGQSDPSLPRQPQWATSICRLAISPPPKSFIAMFSDAFNGPVRPLRIFSFVWRLPSPHSR